MQVRFGPFVLDSESRELLRDSHRVPLSPKAFELLSILVAEQAEGDIEGASFRSGCGPPPSWSRRTSPTW